MEKISFTDSWIRALENPDKRTEYYDKYTPGLAIRVSPTGNKSFVHRYRYGEKVKRMTIGKFPNTRLAQARKRISKNEEFLLKGLDPLEEKKRTKNRPKEITVSELIDLFLKKHVPTLKTSTQLDYKRRARIIKDALGDVIAKELNRKDIILFLEDVLESNNAPIQSNRLKALLSSIYSFGSNRGIVEFNPVATVKALAKENTRRRFYSDNEIKILWQRIELEAEPFRSYFKILFLCGQRAGETRLAEWNHLTSDNWLIPAENTKPNREQNLPISDFTFNVFNEIRELAVDAKYIFASPRVNNEPIAWVQNAAKRIRDNCSVNDFRIHDIRTTVMTNLAKLGYDRTVIGKILNHAEFAGDNSVTAIYDQYGYSEQKKEALQKWADQLQRIIT